MPFDPNLAHSGLDRLQNIEQYLAGSPENAWTPADHGFATWAYDPTLANTGITTVSGSAYFTALKIDQATTVSTLWFNIANAASTATSGQNFVGLYQGAGASANQLASIGADTLFTSAGVASASFTAPLALTAGMYYVCLMGNATTPMHPGALATAGGIANVNLAAAARRYFTNTSGNTTSIPASITLSSNVVGGPIWAALS